MNLVAANDLPAPTTAARVSDSVLFNSLLEGIPEYVNFKDMESRYIAVSRSFMEVIGVTHPSQIIGRRIFDIFDNQQSRRGYDDDQIVVRSGMAMMDQLEHVVWPTGRSGWLLTSRMPLRNRAGEIIGTFVISRDVTDKKVIEAALEKAHHDLLEASRVAGMAEVATGVLHNVGNVLNSLNVSASMIATGLRHSKADSLARIAALLREHQHDLGTFISADSKGRRVPEFIASLAKHSVEERDRLVAELASLQKNVDHIKEIVTMQQAYATMIGVVEPLDPVSLIEDAVRMNSGALQRHDVRVDRDFQPVPKALGEQAKVLQILVNLIRNAKYACDDSGKAEKLITLRTQAVGADRVQMIVQDNGVGIPAENLTKIFQHGFTTRAKGHGFGLHSAANAAREMKGTLTVMSNGAGTGACFTLDLPVAPPSPVK